MSQPDFYTQPTPPKSNALKIILIILAVLTGGFFCIIIAAILIIGGLTMLGSRVEKVENTVSAGIVAPPIEQSGKYPLATITEQGVESGDKLFRITKPGTMQPTSILASESTLQMLDVEADQYLVVYSTLAQNIHEDGYQFAEYQELSATYMLSEMIDGSINNTTPVTIDGLSGTRYEISGQIYDTEATYWLTILDGKDSYYEIRAWTTNDSLAKNRASLLEASDSFQVIK